MSAPLRTGQRGMTEAEFEEQLTTDLAAFYDDPYGFAMYAFQWGKGELLGYDGPDMWQRAQMEDLGKRLVANPLAIIRDATASGHGIGKTAQVAILILWAMSTRPNLAGVVTANTMIQLNTKTWRELALWWKRSINAHWFRWSATKFWHKDHAETWYVSAIPNTEHNAQAFAGLHGKYKIIIFDEGSTIPDKIYEVVEGAMTDSCSIWLVYGNPTENTGRFKDCFERDKKRWKTRHIDSRTAMMTNKAEINEQIEAYGLDSDFVRIRILGVFPRLGSLQFIPTDSVDNAMLREVPYEAHCMQPPVLGVDVARYGDDKTVLVVRQGRKVLDIRKFREYNTMQVAVEIVAAIKEFSVAVTFVDGVGVGAGVVDRLRMLGYEIIEVNAGEKARDDELYYNKRAEMYDKMRDWLKGGQLPHDQELRQSLIGVQFDFDEKERIRLERKKDMKKRGLPSPDDSDALAHTFAEELGDMKRSWFEPQNEAFEPVV